MGTIGGAIILVLLLVGIFADFLAPYGYNENHIADRLAPPGGEYVLGTDNNGRDLLSRVIYGARISMFVGLGASAIELVLALLIGLTSGFLGGKIDMVIQRFVDAVMCIPNLLIALTVMSIAGPGILQVIIVLGAVSGLGRGARLVRSTVIRIREMLYVDASKAIGAPSWWIMLKHILPNIVAPSIIMFTTVIGHAILSEAFLSFLGLGIPPPYPSWGAMLSTNRQYMLKSPWIALWPGLALSLVVFGINMLGDALRDLLDPRLRGGPARYGLKSRKKMKIEKPIPLKKL